MTGEAPSKSIVAHISSTVIDATMKISSEVVSLAQTVFTHFDSSPFLFASQSPSTHLRMKERPVASSRAGDLLSLETC